MFCEESRESEIEIADKKLGQCVWLSSTSGASIRKGDNTRTSIVKTERLGVPLCILAVW